jgi:hypothetical protein
MNLSLFFLVSLITISCNSSQNYFQKKDVDSIGINNPDPDPVNGAPVAIDLNETIKNDSDYVIELNYSDPEKDQAVFCELNDKKNINTSECVCVNGKCTVSIFKNLNFSGEGTFNFTIKTPDSQSTSARGVLTILNTETFVDVVDPKDPKIDCEKLKASNKNHELELTFTIDDSGSVWIDGDQLGNKSNWRIIQTYKKTIKSGCHLLAIKGYDQYGNISGLIASLKIDGKVVWLSGDKNEFLKVYGPEAPPTNWNQFDFDDSAWSSSQSCTYTKPWGSEAADLIALGARWIWWTSKCSDLKEAYFRLGFTVQD